MRFLLACVLACGCGSKGTEPSVGSGSDSGSASPGMVRPLARVQPTSKLLLGSRRVAIVADQGYYDPGSPVVERGTLSTELAKLRAGFEHPELFLGMHPIVVGGEEHHEKHIQLTPTPREVEIHGHLVRVVALHGDRELWQFEEKLRAHLAVVDASGKVTALPDHELAGPLLEKPSSVTARRCAAPSIKHVIAHGEGAMALLVECNPEAPVRIASYAWPGPTSSIERLPSIKELALEPDFLVAAGERRALVGAAGDRLVIYRIETRKREPLLDKITRVVAAVMTDDGAVWTLTIALDKAGRDEWQVARDGIVVPLADPSGTRLVPSQLGYDTRHGVVILAHHPAAVWLVSER